MITKKTSKQVRSKRVVRIRARIKGTADRPRLAVFRSNMNLYVQAHNDETGTTLFSMKMTGKNVAAAKDLGAKVAESLVKAKISKAVFDRGGYKYHGVIKQLADSVREGGIGI